MGFNSGFKGLMKTFSYNQLYTTVFAMVLKPGHFGK